MKPPINMTIKQTNAIMMWPEYYQQISPAPNNQNAGVRATALHKQTHSLDLTCVGTRVCTFPSTIYSTLMPKTEMTKRWYGEMQLPFDDLLENSNTLLV